MSEWLKWSQFRLLVTLGISYLILAEVVSLFPSDRVTCVVNPAQYGDYYADSDECPALHVFLIKLAATVLEKLGDPNNVTMLATIAIAAFTGTLWWSTYRMQQATLASIGLAREEFNATHRPKIRVKHLWLAGDLWQDQPIIVNLAYVNNGTADAIVNETGVRFVVVVNGRPIPFDPHIPAVRGLRISGERMPSGISWRNRGPQ